MIQRKAVQRKTTMNTCRTFRDFWWKTSLSKAVKSLNRGKPDLLKRGILLQKRGFKRRDLKAGDV